MNIPNMNFPELKSAAATTNELLRNMLLEQRKTNQLLSQLVSANEKNSETFAETMAAALKRAEDGSIERV